MHLFQGAKDSAQSAHEYGMGPDLRHYFARDLSVELEPLEVGKGRRMMSDSLGCW